MKVKSVFIIQEKDLNKIKDEELLEYFKKNELNLFKKLIVSNPKERTIEEQVESCLRGIRILENIEKGDYLEKEEDELYLYQFTQPGIIEKQLEELDFSKIDALIFYKYDRDLFSYIGSYLYRKVYREWRKDNLIECHVIKEYNEYLSIKPILYNIIICYFDKGFFSNKKESIHKHSSVIHEVNLIILIYNNLNEIRFRFYNYGLFSFKNKENYRLFRELQNLLLATKKEAEALRYKFLLITWHTTIKCILEFLEGNERDNFINTLNDLELIKDGKTDYGRLALILENKINFKKDKLEILKEKTDNYFMKQKDINQHITIGSFLIQSFLKNYKKRRKVIKLILEIYLNEDK